MEPARDKGSAIITVEFPGIRITETHSDEMPLSQRYPATSCNHTLSNSHRSQENASSSQGRPAASARRSR